MAQVEISAKSHGSIDHGETTDIITAAGEQKAIILLDTPFCIVRIKLSTEEARTIAAKLAPHIP